ncbi:glycosyltransferase [Lysinibacillus endophyticus]|uniref:glycosyltransferase n=1 Tax=Ureibacillus endophyticus TaxID=1978490 RepID=UPI00209EFAC7|nr:glycosyltransferase [Lysinibacillus endophyticus]MCP1144137.1 glycosyltransferase [Lysinibacillus endophyticus]
MNGMNEQNWRVNIIKKVCHLTSVHPRYDIRIFQKECKSLARHGFDVTLIVNDDIEDETIDGVKIASTKFKPKNRLLRMLLSNKKILKKALEVDAEIYHLHDPELLPIGNKLKRLGKKVIFDSHENYFLTILDKTYIPKLFRSFVANIYKLYEAYSAKKIDAVIIPCTFNNKNPFEKSANKTVVLDNVPILNELYSQFDDEKTYTNRTICHVGLLNEYRGVTHNIRAAAKVKATLLLAGKFFSENYYKKLCEMPEFKYVEYKGYVDRNGVLEIYKKSTIGLCTVLNHEEPIKMDNFNTKIYEYMSMGLPVILTDSPYARRILDQYNFGLAVDPSNQEELCDSINFLLDNPNIAKEMGRNGRLAIKERFNWSIEEQKLISLYKEL